MLRAKQVCVVQKGVALINNVTCELLPGRITSFVGKSGAGKTTLLKACAGLIEVSQGTIVVDGTSLKQCSLQQRSAMLGYVFQDFNLFPHLTVLENCIDPLVIRGIARDDACKKARAVLEACDMVQFSSTYPSCLSGGQKQRVAIARALCLKPHILLLDEPTASLDPFNTDLLVAIIKNMVAQGLTVGVSSQDLSFIQKIMDRVYYLEEGEIKECMENPSEYKNTLYIANFLQ